MRDENHTTNSSLLDLRWLKDMSKVEKDGDMR